MQSTALLDSDGEKLYPRKWNHDFIGLPIVKKEEQYRPTVTETELGEILGSAKPRYSVLFALLAGTGLRIGEALALKPTDMAPDCRVLFVKRSIWHGKEGRLSRLPEIRVETLRRAQVPEDLIGLWLGHARRTVTDDYATGLHRDRAWRREWCDRVGLGFSLNGLHGLQKRCAN